MRKSQRSQSYNSYIQSPQWRAKRAEKISLQGSCEHCGRTANLQVHHLTYERLRRERMDDLQVLCKPCHSRVHYRAAGTRNVPRAAPRHVRVLGKVRGPSAPKQKKKPDAQQARLDALYAEQRATRKAVRLAA